jgi:hypothetical protein
MRILRTQREHRYKLLHRDAAFAATKPMTRDAHLEIVCKTGCSTNKKLHAVGGEKFHIEVNGRLITEQQTAGVLRDQRNKLIAAHNRKDPWSIQAHVRIVYKIKHHDVVGSRILLEEFPDKHPP